MIQSIKPSQYPDGPERTMASFLACWQSGNFDGMADYCQRSWRKNVTSARQQLAMFFSHKKIERVLSINRKASKLNGDVIAELEAIVETRIAAHKAKRLHLRTISANVICENEDGAPVPEGVWGVNPISALREK